MKVGAFTILFDDVDWLRAIVPQLAEFDPVVVVAATQPHQWSDFDAPPPVPPLDDIRAICREHGFHFRCGTFTGTGPEAISRQREAGFVALRELGAEAVAWFATDEIYTVDHARALRAAIESDPAAVWKYSGNDSPVCVFWYNTEWEVTYWPPIPGLPIAYDVFRAESGDCMAPADHTVRYLSHDIACYHFAFARPEDEMRRKAFGWGHAHHEHSPLWWKAWNEWVPGKPIYWPPQVPVPARVALPDELLVRLAPILARLRPTPKA